MKRGCYRVILVNTITDNVDRLAYHTECPDQAYWAAHNYVHDSKGLYMTVVFRVAADGVETFQYEVHYPVYKLLLDKLKQVWFHIKLGWGRHGHKKEI